MFSLNSKEGVTMIACVPRRPIQALLAAAVLTVAMNALPPAHADGGGTFSLYDVDRNGYLDRSEFETFVASKRNRADVLEFWAFARVDTDGDGGISEQEMVNALLDEIKRKRK
jgi:hypothetical protein